MSEEALNALHEKYNSDALDQIPNGVGGNELTGNNPEDDQARLAAAQAGPSGVAQRMSTTS